MAANRSRRALAAGALAALVAASAAATGRPASVAAEAACPQQRAGAGYESRVERALRSKADLWGDALVRAPGGPTYEGVRRYLKPLLEAGGPRRSRLTDSGVYYLAFAQPLGVRGAGSVALHVADGSQIVAERAGGRRLTVGVGAGGRERYGSCLARLAAPRLVGGYLPILETSYVDAAGVRYRQQSFAGRIPETRSLVSFVRLTAEAPRSTTQIRFTPSLAKLAVDGNRLVRGGETYLLFSPGGAFDGSSLTYSLQEPGPRTIYLAWLDRPSPSRDLALDDATYERARDAVVAYWEKRLSEGTTFVVPERRVLDAERNLLIQNLVLTWRYSIGNDYEEFAFPESVDTAAVMGEYGFGDVQRAILAASLRRQLALYPNWVMGEKLLGSALYYGLFRDRAYVAETATRFRGYLAALGRQLAESDRGLLRKERYASDLPDSVYGLDNQAVVWQGLRLIAPVWAATGHGDLARTSRRLAARLGAGLRSAVRASERRLSDGSLFIPVKLLEGEPPYDALTASKAGSYWNLVMPYALASGLFRPGGGEARGVLRYLSAHGSRFLGLVRAGAYSLYGDGAYPKSGSDEVYGLHMARFLADNDRPAQLVLSFYGALGAGMTENTFVSGEAASIAPVAGEYFRSMYLPPNSVSNAAFLETLRLMLIHETARGLELAYATPRAWLRPGKRIVVQQAPTSFGPVSYSVEATAGVVRASLRVPDRAPVRTLRLRLRLPGRKRLTGVTLEGRPFRRFDPAAETIDLSGRRGELELVARYAPG